MTIEKGYEVRINSNYFWNFHFRALRDKSGEFSNWLDGFFLVSFSLNINPTIARGEHFETNISLKGKYIDYGCRLHVTYLNLFIDQILNLVLP